MSRRSGNASKTRGAAASSRDTGPTLFDMTTCEPSAPTPRASTSSVVGSPAKTCRSREQELASLVREAVCGSSSQESFARLDRASLSWRTSRRSLLADSTSCSVSFPKRGMMRFGSIFELRTLALHTSGRGSSWWPTPTQSDRDSSARMTCLRTKAWKSRPGTTLTDAVRLASAGLPMNTEAPHLSGAGMVNPDWSEALMGFPAGWTR